MLWLIGKVQVQTSSGPRFFSESVKKEEQTDRGQKKKAGIKEGKEKEEEEMPILYSLGKDNGVLTSVLGLDM